MSVVNANKQSPTTNLKMADVANCSVLLKNALLDPGTAEAFRTALEPLISKQTAGIFQLASNIKGLEETVSKQSTELMSLKRQIRSTPATRAEKQRQNNWD